MSDVDHFAPMVLITAAAVVAVPIVADLALPTG